MSYDDLQARPHFEAAISDIAKMYGEHPKDLRSRIKFELQAAKKIEHSTTELSEEDLKALANRLTAFHADQDNRPPEERSELNLQKILL